MTSTLNDPMEDPANFGLVTETSPELKRLCLAWAEAQDARDWKSTSSLSRQIQAAYATHKKELSQ